MAGITNIKANDLMEENLRTRGTTLVDFWAAWCGPCRMLAPSVDKLATEYDGKLSVCKLNIDEETDAAISMGVESIPTLIMFKDGKEVDRLIGAVPPAQLKSFVDNNL